MSSINVTNVVVHNNPAPFASEFQFEIEFECIADLGGGDIEWKLTYVGSANSDSYDQELDEVEVGPVMPGQKYKIIFAAEAPDIAKIPPSELLGVTVAFLSCSFHGREFVRVGYYVRTDYDSEELNTEPPATPIPERLVRTIVADQPRVTRYQIDWMPPGMGQAMETPAAEGMEGMAQQAAGMMAEAPMEQVATTPPASLNQAAVDRLMEGKAAEMEEEVTGPERPPSQPKEGMGMQPVPFAIA